MANILITGSNRGLGLEWVRQLAAENHTVFATCRYPETATDLQSLVSELPNIHIYRMDVTELEDMNAVSVALLKTPIDLIINNAGVYLEKFTSGPLAQIRFEDWEHTIRVNTLGALRVTHALMNNLLLGKNPLVVAISSHMGSISDIEESNGMYYRSSKAALNAAMKTLSHELKKQHIGVLILHPGWVKTRMGGEGTDLMPVDSVKGMRRLIDHFTMADTGQFYRYDGVQMPW